MPSKTAHTVSQRNQSMEIAKLIAVFFVVVLHVRLPGDLGRKLAYTGVFAVPLFFAITGYFNYRASSSQVYKRMLHAVKLYCVGFGVYCLGQGILIAARGGTAGDFLLRILPDHEGLTKWVVLQEEFLTANLWYVHALVVIYGVYWAYLRFFDGTQVPEWPLFAAGFFGLGLFLALGVILPIFDSSLPVSAYRNGFLMGIPLFVLGMFIRGYQQRLVEKFALTCRKLALLVLLGFLLVMQQSMRFSVGEAGYPFGILIITPALLLLLAMNPTIAQPGTVAETVTYLCGRCSTGVYLIHMTVSEFYSAFLQPHLCTLLPAGEGWLRPVIVFVISAVLALPLSKLFEKPRR